MLTTGFCSGAKLVKIGAELALGIASYGLLVAGIMVWLWKEISTFGAMRPTPIMIAFNLSSICASCCYYHSHCLGVVLTVKLLKQTANYFSFAVTRLYLLHEHIFEMFIFTPEPKCLLGV